MRVSQAKPAAKKEVTKSTKVAKETVESAAKVAKPAAKKVNKATKAVKKPAEPVKKDPEVPIDEDEFVEAEYLGGMPTYRRTMSRQTPISASDRTVHGCDYQHGDQEGRAQNPWQKHRQRGRDLSSSF